HSKTCRRPVRVQNRMRTTRCRFGFPRPVLRRTLVLDESKKYRIPGVTSRPYYLARNPAETHVNDYNSAILLAWGANIDVQFIPSNSKDVVNYITAYTTKGEKAKRSDKGSLDKYALQGMTKSKAIFQLGFEICERKEVGLLELVDDLMGHENFQFDMGHVFIPSDAKDKRLRMLVPKNQLKDDDLVYQTNWLDTYYPNRSVKLEKFSLYNIMINFEVITIQKDAKSRRNRVPSKDKKTKKNLGKKYAKNDDDETEFEDDESIEFEKDVENSDQYHVRNPLSPFYDHADKYESGDKVEIQKFPTKWMRKMKQKVARFFLPRLIWEDIVSVEDYYSRLVRVFVPWRNEEGILEVYEKSTYAEVWKQYLENLKNEDERAWEDITKLLAGYTKLQNEEAELGERMEQIKKAKEALEVDEEVEE
uniref:ATP-dependent DNA helicase n=1 Tax=Caenorhabditis japonica TaxID=281687 RepID=A0A8R1EWZ1_CAEJA